MLQLNNTQKFILCQIPRTGCQTQFHMLQLIDNTVYDNHTETIQTGKGETADKKCKIYFILNFHGIMIVTFNLILKI